MTGAVARAFESTQPEVIVNREGVIGRIRLNRPKALNSLNLEMVRSAASALDDFERNSAVRCVLIDAPERGFCAGGDIRAIHASGRASDGMAQIFWAEEYRLNVRIASFSKPVVTLMDGIVMGGGVGLACHATHRVVTERTSVAMPEVGIGFIPDVGGTWLLSRAPGETGTWLALTGNAVGAADAIHLGLADVYMPSEKATLLVADLFALGAAATACDVDALLAKYSDPAPRGLLEDEQAIIDRAFAHDEVEDVLSALKADPGEFAARTAAAISMRSPTSLKVAMRLLRLARKDRRLSQSLNREYRAACRTLRGSDFYEGVRAAVIDKDRNPRWSPARLEGVTEAVVREHLPFADPTFDLFYETSEAWS